MANKPGNDSGWATHFGNLAEPLQCEQFDQQHREVVHKGILAINKNVREQILPSKLITIKELHNALKKLKNNKAADLLKLTSEHFKLSIGVFRSIELHGQTELYLSHFKGR